MTQKESHPKLDNPIGMDTKASHDPLVLYIHLFIQNFQLIYFSINVGELKLNHDSSIKETLMMLKESHLK